MTTFAELSRADLRRKMLRKLRIFDKNAEDSLAEFELL